MKVNMLTNAGQDYLNSAFAASSDIELIEIAIGDGTVTSTSEAAALNDLKGRKMTYGISEITTENRLNTIKTVMSNLDLVTGFKIKEVGIFANKSDGSKILFWYVNYDEECSWMQSIGNGLVRSDFAIRLSINADNMTVTNVSTLETMATKQYVDTGLANKLTEVNGKVDKKVHFGNEVSNALHPREADSFAEGAFVTVNITGDHAMGIGGSTNPNEIRIGLVRSLDGTWLDATSQEAKLTNVNYDGGMEAERIKSRSGEISLGANGEAKIKYNSETKSVDFIFEV